MKAHGNANESLGWAILPPATVDRDQRLEHVRYCSFFAAAMLDRFPQWREGLDDDHPPSPAELDRLREEAGLDVALRRFRNRNMLRIVWRDLCGLATLGETFDNLTRLAELCLQATLNHHLAAFIEKHGTPRDALGEPVHPYVIGLGKFGGGELNLSSDIDIMFAYREGGACDGARSLSNDQFFARLARAVIGSLSDITGEGFCFRVDTRLRPYGDSGPLVASTAAMEQYYQREGRDWERYALVKARIVAGDMAAGQALLDDLRPFVYRRYIDYGSVEALQEMHANVQEDARRKDRLDDIKRGPGGIREIEFLAQCFQILRGGREPTLQTASLDRALQQVQALGLLEAEVIAEIRNDYAFLRFLENRIQALRDQQTHRLPQGEDRERLALAMFESDVATLEESLARTRQRVSLRFHGIFPSRESEEGGDEGQEQWTERWRRLQGGRQDDRMASDPAAPLPAEAVDEEDPITRFMRRVDRMSMSQRARRRLDRFMPALLDRIDRLELQPASLNRVIDLVLGISRRSAYLVLLVQQPRALDRMLELFSASDWIADKVIRFPALLDELIDPSLGRQIPTTMQLNESVQRILRTAQGPETALDSLNYLKLSTELRVAVAQLKGNLEAASCQAALSDLAAALIRGALAIATGEVQQRYGLPGGGGEPELAVMGYGTLGAREMSYNSDLDIVFLFQDFEGESDGKRPLTPERYYARLAQRVLSLLTLMTPSGRLYEVDTRLRPNGRAGSLVSHVRAFSDYQHNEAWTWELQALTRARFITGHHDIEVQFNRIRQDVLCQARDEAALRAQLAEMRDRMAREHPREAGSQVTVAAKHRPGGLVDIEFIAQLGVLCQAATYPRLVRATSTLDQLGELAAVRWLSEEHCRLLIDTLSRLREQRMLASLGGHMAPDAVDTRASEALFEQIVGRLPAPG
jgi:glutamate-ammonia-ligase adenylyltransferase